MIRYSSNVPHWTHINDRCILKKPSQPSLPSCRMKMNTLVPTRCFFRLLPFSVEPRMRIRKKAKRIHRKTPRTTNQMKKKNEKNDEDKKSREKEWKEKGTVSMYGIVCCVWCACADLSINKFHLRYKKLHLCIFLVPLVWHGAFFALVLSLHSFFSHFSTLTGWCCRCCVIPKAKRSKAHALLFRSLSFPHSFPSYLF